MIDYSEYIQQIKTKRSGENVLLFCSVRKKWIVSAPEEMVRQAAILYLVSLGYPAKHISVERQIVYNQLSKRYDIVVSNKSGNHLILVECKAPHIPLNQSVLDQAGIYNLALGGEYIWVTNGHDNKMYAIDHLNRKSIALDYIPLPSED